MSAQIINLSLQTQFDLSNGFVYIDSKIDFIFSEGTFSTLKTNGAIKYEIFNIRKLKKGTYVWQNNLQTPNFFRIPLENQRYLHVDSLGLSEINSIYELEIKGTDLNGKTQIQLLQINIINRPPNIYKTKYSSNITQIITQLNIGQNYSFTVSRDLFIDLNDNYTIETSIQTILPNYTSLVSNPPNYYFDSSTNFVTFTLQEYFINIIFLATDGFNYAQAFLELNILQTNK